MYDKLTRILLLVLLLSGCTDEPDTAVAESQVFSEGEGETNVEPLWPLSPGARWQATATRQDAWVESPRQIEGRSVLTLRSTFSYMGALADKHWPPEPVGVGWWTQDSEGIAFHGQMRRGLMETPSLFVPNTVRVGMHWSSGHFSHKVVAREVMDTAFGRKPVWFLLTHEVGFGEFGAQWLNAYIEGRGPISPEEALRGFSAFDEFFGQDGLVVVPLDSPAPPSVSSRSGELQSLGSVHIGSAFGADGLLPTSISAVQLPGDGPETMHVIIEGLNFGIPECTDIGGGEQCNVAGAIPTLVCLTLPDFTPLPTEACVAAHGTSISETGDVAQIQLNHLGQVTTDCPNNNGGPACSQRLLEAVYHDSTGKARVISAANSTARFAALADHAQDFTQPNQTADYYGPLSPDALPSTPTPRLVEDFGATTSVLSELVQFLRFDVFDHDSRDVPDGHRVTNANSLNVFAGEGGREVLRTTFDGRIERVVIGEEGVSFEHVVDVELPAGHFLGGAVPYGDNRLLIATNGDFQGMGSPLGFTGLSAWCDALRGTFTQMPLHPDAPCTGAMYDYDGETVVGQVSQLPEHSSIGDVYFWLLDVPAPQPIAETSLHGLEVWEVGPDALICWPPEHGEVDTGGWEISGDIAIAFPVGNRCVFVTRAGHVGDTFDDTVATEVIGPIPGAGRTAIGIHRELWEREKEVDMNVFSPANAPIKSPGWRLVPTGCALLSDGRCVSPYRVWSEFRFLSEVHPATEPTSGLGVQVVGEDITLSVYCAASEGSPPCAVSDLAGAGLWVQLEDAVQTVSIDEVGLLTATELVRFPGYREPRLTVQGGGVLVVDTTTGDQVILFADGTTIPAAPLPADNNLVVSTTRPDGSVCGYTFEESIAGDVFCIDAAGEESRFPLPYVPESNEAPPMWIDSGETSYLWRQETEQLIHIDFTAQTATRIEPAALGVDDPVNSTFVIERAVRNAEGTSYLIITTTNLFGSQTDLFELGAVGLERIDIPRLNVDPSDVSVAVALGMQVIPL